MHRACRSSIESWRTLNRTLSSIGERSASTSAKRILATNSENLIIADSLDLQMELFNNFFSFLHDLKVALVHVVRLEEISRIESLVLEDGELFVLCGGFQLEL